VGARAGPVDYDLIPLGDSVVDCEPEIGEATTAALNVVAEIVSSGCK
jgi:hypothetical protein